jgi:hypothetical protein
VSLRNRAWRICTGKLWPGARGESFRLITENKFGGREDKGKTVRRAAIRMETKSFLGKARCYSAGREGQVRLASGLLCSLGDDMKQPGLLFDEAAKYARFVFLCGYYVANGADKPTWNKGDFFGGQ